MPIVGTGTGITGGIEPAPAIPLSGEERTFWGEVDKFKVKADEAYTVWQGLRAKRQAASSNPQLQAEYDQVMESADNMGARVSDVEKAVAAVKTGIGESIIGWGTSVFGLEGMNEAKSEARAYLGDLGIAQFAIVAVAAAIAWIGSWLADAYIVDRKLTAVEKLVAQGVPIDEAGNVIADKGAPSGIDIFFEKAGTGVALAGIAAVVLYFFFEKKRGF